MARSKKVGGKKKAQEVATPEHSDDHAFCEVRFATNLWLAAEFVRKSSGPADAIRQAHKAMETYLYDRRERELKNLDALAKERLAIFGPSPAKAREGAKLIDEVRETHRLAKAGLDGMMSHILMKDNWFFDMARARFCQ
ncbi:MAG: hypothetical protein IT443_12015 [Phycisphaeraceae bacterium]|nr:hypothetical protein [Phycisphaeraceae bacterium]